MAICGYLKDDGAACLRPVKNDGDLCWQHREDRPDKIGGNGQPTLYRPEYDKQAYKLCLLGAIDKELADFFEVTETTINNWKLAQPSFFESVKKGKMAADAEVAYKLYHKARGFSHKDVKFATHEGKITDSKEYVKHYPPDTTAAIFWLKNRQPRTWRDKTDVELSGEVEINVTLEDG